MTTIEQPAADGQTRFVERWRAPVWYWLVGLAMAGGIAALFHMGYAGWLSALPYVATVSLVAGLLWWLGKIEVRVTSSMLFVDDAKLSKQFVERAEPLTAEAYRAALSSHFDPLAFVVRRPWIPRAVLITLNDPDDPTPYWIVSSRRPEALASAINER